jgi:DTW domain-containing protein YfiP
MTGSRCKHCLRPGTHCLCGLVKKVSSQSRVLILQHTSERKHALNTGRLAVLGLENAELWVGETFPDLASRVAQAENAHLLFPGPGARLPAPLEPANGDSPILLIVPDGTWRKARKILYANPLLNTLPRLGLSEGPASRYRLRKTDRPDAVSTVEAIVRTLSLLEPEQDFQPVLRPFDALIEQQISAMGADAYRRYYESSEEQRAQPQISADTL